MGVYFFRKGESHWLYIPPSKGKRGDPNFAIRCVDHTEIDGLEVAIVWVSGLLRNAGPKPAMSVRIEGRGPYRKAERIRRRLDRRGEDAEARWNKFPRNKDIFLVRDPAVPGDLTPILYPYDSGRGSTSENEIAFLAAGLYKPTDPDLKLLDPLCHKGDPFDFRWFDRGLQIHPVRARSRTVLGSRKKWNPQKLCVPFEGRLMVAVRLRRSLANRLFGRET